KYWAMQNVAELKNIRAGMFDLELQNNRWVERRDFLLAGRATNAGAAVSKQSLGQIQRILPDDAPYAQIRSVDGKPDAAADLVRESLFDREATRPRGSRRWNWAHYGGSDFEVAPEEDRFSGYSRYSSLDYKY